MYERRYFGYLRRWAAALDGREWSHELWGREDLATGAPTELQCGLVGPPPWSPREYLAGPPGEPSMGERCFELAGRSSCGGRGRPSPLGNGSLRTRVRLRSRIREWRGRSSSPPGPMR